jgi:hypothetical protein
MINSYTGKGIFSTTNISTIYWATNLCSSVVDTSNFILIKNSNVPEFYLIPKIKGKRKTTTIAQAK